MKSAVGFLFAAAAGFAAIRGQTQTPAAPGVAANSEVPKAELAIPRIKTARGLTAKVVVPPGIMYDPLSVLVRPNGMLWVNDDGGVVGQRGGYVWGVDRQGKVTKVIDASRMMPST